ncbi:MAG: glycosyltransferase, partial [Planctomycetota bacterium]|nr:glycosyltransferase [Planctomycetota bacterium]
RCWRELGNATALFALSPGSGVAPALAQFDVAYEHWRGWRDWVLRYPGLVRRVIAWQPDLVYLRFTTCFPALRKLLHHVPTVLEINTDDLTEYRLTMSRKAFAYHRLTRGKLLRRARGIVAVTHELGDRYHLWATPITVVSNGIRLDEMPLYPAPNNPQPRLLFLGQNRMPWHGVDQVSALAQLCPQWQFEVVGDESFGVTSSPPNVRFHGFASAAEYQGLLAKADVALGTLALYRKSMSESCALKVRDYLACGVPTIMAGRDTDFQQEVPFVLQLPNTPDNVERSVDRIRQFVDDSLGSRVPREAIQHLDVKTKESQRLAFFASVLEQQKAADGGALLDS